MTNLIEHLDRQLESSRRLLAILLAQAESIRKQDVEGVLARLHDVQAELVVRERIEAERDELLRGAALTRNASPDTIDLETLLAPLGAVEAERGRAKSAELRGLLAEIGRVHEQNRVLIRQELAFLDHLMRLLSGTPQGGYSPTGFERTAPAVNAVDARA